MCQIKFPYCPARTAPFRWKVTSQPVRFLHFFTALLFILTISAFADTPTVTGQWDFKFGDLRATIGSDLQYIGNTSNLTMFTTAKISGQAAQVMSFGANSTNQGFYMRHGAKANGGGQFVNQYTVIMDVMYPNGNSVQDRPIIQSDPFNHPGTGALFSVGTSATGTSGLGSGNQSDAPLSPNTWYRVAFAVDLTAQGGGQLTKYVNGQPVGTQSLSGGIDGHYALGPTAQLFTSGTVTSGAATQPGYVNCIQFLNGCMSANALAALGGPSAIGIPSGSPKLQIATGNWQSPSTKFSWPGRPNSSLQVQFATNLAGAPAWQTLGTLNATRSLTIPTPVNPGTAGFFRVTGALPTTIDPGLSVDPDILVSTLPSGEQSLPTKQIIHTPGQVIRFPGSPVDLAMSRDGSKMYIKNISSILVVDVASWSVLQTVKIAYGTNGTMHGIATSPDGKQLFATTMPGQLYDWAIGADGMLSLVQGITLPLYSDPCGVAISPDSSTAYVCLGRSNSLAVVNIASATVIQMIPVGMAPWEVVLSGDGSTAYVSDWGGRPRQAGDLFGNSSGSLVVQDSRGVASTGMDSIVDLIRNVEVAEIPTGLHPSDEALSADGSKLYVANANSDTVTVINTQSRSVQETFLTRPDPTLPFGSAPDSLALSPDGTMLYVANTGNNAIAVFELPNTQHTNSLLQGFIPTDWYPGALAADANNLYVINTKGLGTLGLSVTVFNGSADKIPIPTAEVLNKYTAQVQENSRVPQMLQGINTNLAVASAAPVPVPVHVGEPSVFQHVLYIIKENKTYDQMFGDLTNGNGNPYLCIYPQLTSPNHHALATQYVLLDNYYCNGVFSTDGHSWCTEANSTAYWEKGMGVINRSGQTASDPLIYSSSGFIWDNVMQHGLTFWNYGVMSGAFPHPSSSTWLQVYNDYLNKTGLITYGIGSGQQPPLAAHTTTNISGFNLSVPDQMRADGFLKEFNIAQSNGVWPAFDMCYLPNDHTSGGSPGYPTPRAQVADNDLALGRIVEAVTKSVFGSNTVIFVIEDDPQSGYDHVDAHRSICLVISPYTKRGQTVSTFYNQVGLIHTMEQIMGLPPMNQMDAMGPLMGDCFTSQPNFTPYTALSNNIPLNEMSPGTLGALSRKDRYWAKESLKMDFSKPDQVDDNMLNRLIWHSIKGDARYPAEFVGTHDKTLKKLGLVASKKHKDDDDD